MILENQDSLILRIDELVGRLFILNTLGLVYLQDYIWRHLMA